MLGDAAVLDPVDVDPDHGLGPQPFVAPVHHHDVPVGGDHAGLVMQVRVRRDPGAQLVGAIRHPRVVLDKAVGVVPVER